MTACGLDFGTSNSAIGVMRGGAPVLAPVEGDATLIPSAVFFDYENKGQVLFGGEAIATYIGQHDGRLMRALKSILSSSLIDEKTALGNRRVPLTEVVEIFVRYLKEKAEAFAGQELTGVVHGRPVRFVDGDDSADAKAQRVLEGIAHKVGFRDVAFVYEPIAAAHHYEETATREEIVLIADIGGGTSDFTIIRIGPGRRLRDDRSSDILANDGARIGGTDFDALLSMDTAMPVLGLGTQLVTKNLPMPNALYFELATWPTINFAYTLQNERMLRELVADAREPEKVARLLKVVRQRLGHRIAFAVEDAKIALSEAESAVLSLDFIEAGLDATATRGGFDHAIAEKTERLHRIAATCIRDAGLKPADIDTIFFTGGSGRVPAVRAAIMRAANGARATEGSDFLSVALGLTREARKRFR
jgi:hypothetical chaperone protein